MKTKYESENLNLILWRNIYKTYTLFKKCEDKIFEEQGLTTEQYATLMTIKFLEKPVRPIDVARWLERSPNSVSMLVERMVKAGLIKTVRDKKDRRAVHLTITSKAEDAFKPATTAALIFIQKVLSPLSQDNKHTLISLLTLINREIFQWLNAGADIEDVEEMMINEAERYGNLMARLSGSTSPSTPKTKRQSGEKRKTIR